MNFVEVKGLGKSYNNTKVIENMNFTIKKGEFITLLGPSGCGKSTLLRCIAGLESIDKGDIYIEDKEISKLSPKDRDISMVFQAYALFPNMTVRENIGFGLKMKKITKEITKKEVDKIIHMVELEGKENSYPNQLSGGQQQRVALARALVMEPKILLLDEPLSALDAKIRRNLRLEIRNLQKKLNITTIFVTHDQEEALIISDRVFVMDKGEISQMGTPKEIYTAPENEFVAGFIGNYNVFTKEEIEELGEVSMQDQLFAVRPETIYISEEKLISNDNTIQFQGIIEDLIVLGNVLRCFVKVKQKIIIVDMLNRVENNYNINQKVNLFITKEDCKKIK